MGWAGFTRCHLLATSAEGGIGIFGAGRTVRKTCGACSHVDTGGCNNEALRSAGEPLTLFLVYIYICASSPYLFVKQVCQIGNMEGFFSWGIICVQWHRGAAGILEAGVMWHWWPWRS